MALIIVVLYSELRKINPYIYLKKFLLWVKIVRIKLKFKLKNKKIIKINNKKPYYKQNKEKSKEYAQNLLHSENCKVIANNYYENNKEGAWGETWNWHRNLSKEEKRVHWKIVIEIRLKLINKS